MDKFKQHIKRMQALREVYEVGTGQHNILSMLINECEESLRHSIAIPRSEELFCGRNLITCIYFDEGKCKHVPSECRDQVSKQNISSSNVPIHKLNELLQRWEYLIAGVPSDNDQVVAIKTCINDLKIVVSVYCHNG